MQARASFRGAPPPTAFVRLFIAGLLAAFLLGGAGGYLVRGLGFTVSTTTTNSTDAHHPLVIESGAAPSVPPVVSPLQATSTPIANVAKRSQNR